MRQKSNKIKSKRLKTAKANQNCFVDVAELFVEYYRYIAVESKEQTIYLIIQKSTMKETARNTTPLLDITKQTTLHPLITQVTAPGAGDGGGRRAAGGAAGCGNALLATTDGQKRAGCPTAHGADIRQKIPWRYRRSASGEHPARFCPDVGVSTHSTSHRPAGCPPSANRLRLRAQSPSAFKKTKKWYYSAKVL